MKELFWISFIIYVPFLWYVWFPLLDKVLNKFNNQKGEPNE